MKKCFFGCNVVWEKEMKDIPMVHTSFEGGIKMSETPYVIQVQMGVCPRCGKIYRRKIE